MCELVRHSRLCEVFNMKNVISWSSLSKKLFDYSAVINGARLPSVEKKILTNCSPFLLNKPLVNITKMAGALFMQHAHTLRKPLGKHHPVKTLLPLLRNITLVNFVWLLWYEEAGELRHINGRSSKGKMHIIFMHFGYRWSHNSSWGSVHRAEWNWAYCVCWMTKWYFLRGGWVCQSKQSRVWCTLKPELHVQLFGGCSQWQHQAYSLTVSSF